MTLDKIELGVDVPAVDFVMPEVKKEEAKPEPGKAEEKPGEKKDDKKNEEKPGGSLR
jgi:hypothetical protein